MNVETAAAFIAALTGDSGTPVTFQTFGDRKEDRDDPELRESLARTLHGPLRRHARALEELNNRRAGIFITVNATDLHGRKTENIAALRALFVDCDTGDLPELPLPPSIVVQSGHGQHAYWLLRPGQPLEAFRRAQERLSEALGTDPAVKDLPRVMRLPGFTHHKGEPFAVQLLETHPDRRYTIEQVLAALPPESAGAERPAPAPVFNAPPGMHTGPLDNIDRARAYMAKVPGAVEGAGGDAATYRAACLARDFALDAQEALDVLREWNQRCFPPWSDEELEQKVRNAYRYATGAPGSKLTDRPLPPPPRAEEPPPPTDSDMPPPRPEPAGTAEPKREKQGKPKIPRLSQADCLREWRALGNQQSVPTGIPSLDKAIGGGLPLHQITLVAGYASVGKSEFCRQVRRRVAAAGYPVIHLDVELGAPRIFERDLAQECGIPAGKLRSGQAELSIGELERLREAEEKLAADDRIVTMNPGGCPETTFILGALEEAVAATVNGKPALIILDSLQRLAAGFDAENPRLQMTGFLNTIEWFARSHHVAMLCTCEQKRGATGGTPTADEALTSGAESRAIEYVADVLLGLYRKEKTTEQTATDADTRSDRYVEVVVGKNRQGPSGILPEELVFEAPCWGMRVEERGLDDLEEKILEALEDGKPRRLNVITRQVKRRKEAVVGALHHLQSAGEVTLRDGGWLLSDSPFRSNPHDTSEVRDGLD